MDTITSETTNENATSTHEKGGGEEPFVCMLSRKCDAGGEAEDGGHVFDQESEHDPGNAWCRCGMDVITYTCWFRGF
jgi:hypothetical protein